VLRYGATAAGVGAIGALSGCSAIESLLGGGSNPGYAGWLPAPDEIGDDDHYRFNSVNTAELRDAESESDDRSFDYLTDPSRINSNFYITGVAPEDIDEWIRPGPMYADSGGSIPTVVFGDFAKSDVTDTIDDKIDESDADVSEESVGGYTLYSAESGGSDIAVTEGTVILGPEDGSSESVETVIGTDNGEVDRYAEMNEDMDALVDALGQGTLVIGETMNEIEETDIEAEQFRGQVAVGAAIEINGASADVETVVVFDSEDDIDMDAIGNSTESDAFEDYNDVSSSRSGRTVTITGTTDTENFFR